MNIIQFEDHSNQRAIGVVENNQVFQVNRVTTVRELALLAIEKVFRLKSKLRY